MKKPEWAVIIKSIETKRLYVQIADQLRTLIDEKKITPGDRLPPERDLARQLGVSRPSLREALIALEIEGRIEIRMGSGVFVCQANPPKQGKESAPLGESPLEIMKARALIETAIIAQVAPHIRPKDIQHLKQLVADMERQEGDATEHLMTDHAFHIYLASLSGNDVLVRLIGELFKDRFSPISTKFNTHFQNRETLAGADREHRAIVEALEAKDSILAQAAMHKHLTTAYERMVVKIQNGKQKP